MSAPIVAVLGGSSAFTPLLVRALIERGVSATLRLMGRSADRLDAVARFARMQVDAAGAAIVSESTTEVDEALDGATVVVNQVRVGGWAGREHDDTFPLAHGVPGDETLGPGGLASALRTLPVVDSIADRCARLAPDAWFVNMTNPMGVVLAGLATARAFGLCELPLETLRRALYLVGVDPGDDALAACSIARYAGQNHQGLWYDVRHDGRDVVAAFAEALDARPEDGAWFGVSGDDVRALGGIPLHYVALRIAPERVVAARRSRSTGRGAQLAALTDELFAHYAATDDATLPDALSRRATPWIADALVPAIDALLGGAPTTLAVSRRNADAVPGVAPDTIVERLVRVDADGPHWPRDDALPPTIVEAIAAGAAFERAAVAAARAPTRDAIARALRLSPLVVPVDQLEPLIDAVLAVPPPLEAAR